MTDCSLKIKFLGYNLKIVIGPSPVTVNTENKLNYSIL